MQPGLGDVQVNLVGLAAVDLFGALLAFPPLVVFALAPLQPLAGRRPRPVEPDMEPVVFTARRVGPYLDVVTAGRVEMHGVGEDRHFPRLVREVLPRDELVVVRAPCVGQDFHISSSTGGRGVIVVPVRLYLGRHIGGHHVPPSFLRRALLREVLGLDGDQPVPLFERNLSPLGRCEHQCVQRPRE